MSKEGKRKGRRRKTDMKDNGSRSHYFVLEPYEQYISRGTCDCGAVKFFANDMSKESRQLADHYNREKGKEGNGHMVTQEANMAGRNEPSSVVTVANQEAPPVPPKPRKRKLRKKYFEDNKGAILRDYKKLKLKEFLARWMAVNTWMRLKKEWGIQGKRPVSLGTFTVQEDIGLPDFPAFNEQWSDYVKTNWFETYQALKELEVNLQEEKHGRNKSNRDETGPG